LHSWELFACQIPFHDSVGNPVALAMKIMKGSRPDINAARDCPPALKTLITNCWDAEPKKRPTMEVVVSLIRETLRNMSMDIPDDIVCPLWFVSSTE
jgi:hypothetical protein